MLGRAWPRHEVPEHRTLRSGEPPPDQVVAKRSRCTAASWDEFAIASGASFRCTHLGARLWCFEHSLNAQIRYFELFTERDGAEVKMGQCAIAHSKVRALFLDQIQLAEGYEGRWLDALRALLRQVKSRKYVYGSEWSLDDARDQEIASMPEMRIVASRALTVQMVDFTLWTSWEDYERVISNNVKRCSRKSFMEQPGAEIKTRRGLAALLDVRRGAEYRMRLFARKGLQRKAAKLVLRSALRIIATRAYTQSVRLIFKGRTMAFYHAIQMGVNTFYLEGAGVRPDNGAQWRLLLTMLKAAYVNSGGVGRFVMGPADAQPNSDPAWQGLIRSRHACRTRDHPTSIVVFAMNAEA